MYAYKMLIDGQLVEGAKTIEIVNPATAEPFTTAPVADEDQLNAAVAAARRAFPAWAATSWSKRRDCLLLFAQRLEEEADHFARLLISERRSTGRFVIVSSSSEFLITASPFSIIQSPVHHVAALITWRRVNSHTPSMPPSVPTPDCFAPEKGMSG